MAMLKLAHCCVAQDRWKIALLRKSADSDRQWAVSDPAPNLVRNLDHECQFAALQINRQLVAVMRAGETALRAEAKIFERHVLRRRVYPPLEGVLRF